MQRKSEKYMTIINAIKSDIMKYKCRESYNYHSSSFAF
jgi:hypothetical protein